MLAAITQYHRLGGLLATENKYISTGLEAGSSRSKLQQTWSLARAHLIDGYLPSVPSVVEGVREPSGSLLRAIILHAGFTLMI